MGTVSIKNSLTLRSALRTLAGSGQNIEISLKDLIHATSRNILNSTMVRDKDKAIKSLYVEAQQMLVEQDPIKPGSIKWLARISSGLDPVSGKAIQAPVTKADEDRDLVAEAIDSVEKAIARTMKPKTTKLESKATKGTLSIRQAARRASGLGDNGEILF